MTDYERIKREYDLSLLQKNRLTDKIYPIGSIYMSISEVSPAVLFGGVWERLENVFLLASSSSHPAGEQAGEERVTLTVEEIPPHTHTIHYGIAADKPGWAATVMSDATYESPIANATGGGRSHNNMPPYLSVCMWKRVK